MSNIIHLETIADMHRMVPSTVMKHPQAAVIDFSKHADEFDSGIKITTGFYSVMFKNYCANRIKYGQQTYDFQDGSLICVSPRQVVTFDEPVERIEDPKGWGIFFHPDLLRGTSLATQIRDYTFFHYETHEALHLAEKEQQALVEIARRIDEELNNNLDRHSQSVIVSNIQLMLNYCTRFYDRQFITRRQAQLPVVAKVESILTAYFRGTDIQERGLPGVRFLADQVHLSPDYLSDLLKRETGMNAQDRIHYHLIEEAKHRLASSDQSIGELAFALGFEYPQYFSRLFKSKTGLTPVEFRRVS